MKKEIEFTSCMSPVETMEALLYLPMHLLVLPFAVGIAAGRGQMTLAQANLLVYAVGVIYMLCFMTRFLRRDFDPLCDRPLRCLREIAICYAIILGSNIVLNSLLQAIGFGSNPNNAAVSELLGDELGGMNAAVLFMAPIIEELMFRAGIFSALYKNNGRVIAYAVSIGAFSLYHVWSYAILDPMNWIYLLQYIPVSYALCRCYERTDSIWSSILLHMLNNGVALLAMNWLSGLEGLI